MLSMIIDNISSTVSYHIDRSWCVFYNPDELPAGASVSQCL